MNRKTGGGNSDEWWKKPAAKSLGRKAKAAKPEALAKPGDSFLIVTEGTVTEPIYFDLLLKDLRLSSIKVQVIPGDASDPRHVIRSAARIAEDQTKRHRKGELATTEPAKFDHVWAVIDTDVAQRQDFWNDVPQLAEARKVKIAHSTPCFEYWLLLHLSYTTRSLTTGSEAKSALKAALGSEYSTNEAVAKSTFPTFIQKWPEAVRHAERVRKSYADCMPALVPVNPSTEVDKLVRALNNSTPASRQKAV